MTEREIDQLGADNYLFYSLVRSFRLMNGNPKGEREVVDPWGNRMHTVVGVSSDGRPVITVEMLLTADEGGVAFFEKFALAIKERETL